MKITAPAKVNLFLRVIRRRDDGFHEIETRMAPLSLCDELSLEMRESGGLQFSCSNPDLPADESNLVVRAVRALEKRAGRQLNLAIHLTKRIPLGAGLAGGSSDAASTLRGVNQICELGLETGEIREIAAQLGSDVPFFLHGGVCDCRGRGEIVEPVPFPHRLRLLLVKPGFGVSTLWAYQNWRDSCEIPGATYKSQPQTWGNLENSLERPVFAKFPLLADLKSWLLARPEVEAALMSGSGSTTFAILRGEGENSELEADLRAEFGAELWTAVCDA